MKAEGFEHEIPQAMWAKGEWFELKGWILRNFEKLREYNNIDVLCLTDLYSKMYGVITDTCSKWRRLYDYLTIGALSYDIWTVENDYKPKTDPTKCTLLRNDYEVDKFLRRGIIGGRCQVFPNEGKASIEHGQFAMYDVVSLYPFVMKNYPYPNGGMVPTESEVIGKLGIYLCEVIRQPFKRIVPPERVRKTDQLDWHYTDGGPFTRVLVSADIDAIRRHGGEVNVIQGYYFTDKGYVFKDYVEKFEELKNEQDRLRDSGSPEYNAAKRGFFKLILNNLSGKVLQRPFNDKSQVCYTTNQARAFIKKLKRESVMFGLYSKAVLVSGTLAEHAKKVKMPSILGMFIYSYGRNYMGEIIIQERDIKYMDTDSGAITIADAIALRRDRPELFSDLRGDRPKFGDLQEEVCGPAGNAEVLVLLRPKAYMVWNPHHPEKSKRKIKGIGPNDRLILRRKHVTIIMNLIAEKNYDALETIYSTGKIGNSSLCSKPDIEVFKTMAQRRVGVFLCSQMLKKRTFDPTLSDDVSFTIRKVFRLKCLEFK